MSAVCEVCGKHRIVAMKVSHSHRRTKRLQQPNLQRVKVKVGGTVKRMRVCTRCIRSGFVSKA
jgi:large subunit ribosomal protein L28